jgi:hypothetical protein
MAIAFGVALHCSMMRSWIHLVSGSETEVVNFWMIFRSCGEQMLNSSTEIRGALRILLMTRSKVLSMLQAKLSGTLFEEYSRLALILPLFATLTLNRTSN